MMLWLLPLWPPPLLVEADVASRRVWLPHMMPPLSRGAHRGAFLMLKVRPQARTLVKLRLVPPWPRLAPNTLLAPAPSLAGCPMPTLCSPAVLSTHGISADGLP